MNSLKYVIISLLAACAGCTVPCGIVSIDDCKEGYYAVYSESPDSDTYVCIKPDKETGPVTYEAAKALCEADGGFLAEPIGYLHQTIYENILCRGYNHEAFWIGGTDENHEDYWEWETAGIEMPRGTPHWYPCEPSQPLISDTNANHACMWEPDFYFFSCTEGIEILALCQMYPGVGLDS